VPVQRIEVIPEQRDAVATSFTINVWGRTVAGVISCKTMGNVAIEDVQTEVHGILTDNQTLWSLPADPT